MQYYEVSALSGVNINEMFQEFAEGMIKASSAETPKSSLKSDSTK